jgi:hypothetical protein
MSVHHGIISALVLSKTLKIISPAKDKCGLDVYFKLLGDHNNE